MNERLFKLKKKGKTVGYLIITEGAIYIQYAEKGKPSGGYFGILRGFPVFDSIHPFVTKDKNGKDVFAGDKIKAIISDISSSFLTGKIVPHENPLSCWMFKYKFEGKEYLAPAPDLQEVELEEKEDD